MTFIRNLFRRAQKDEEPAVELAPGVQRSSNPKYDLCLSRAVECVGAAEALAASGDHDAFHRLLTGEGDSLIEITPGAGHNHEAVHEAMHIYQRTHPEADMAARFEQALARNNEKMCSRDAANLSFRYIGLQLKKVANENAVFSVNAQQMFYDLMTAIAQHRDEVEDDLPFFGEWLEDRKQFIREYL